MVDLEISGDNMVTLLANRANGEPCRVHHCAFLHIPSIAFTFGGDGFPRAGVGAGFGR